MAVYGLEVNFEVESVDTRLKSSPHAQGVGCSRTTLCEGTGCGPGIGTVKLGIASNACNRPSL